MQPLTAAPRDGLTEAQVRAILTDASVIDAGADLLDPVTGTWNDISADLLDGTIARDCLATIHGTCSLRLTRQLPWGSLAAQVRPWQSLALRTGGAWLSATWRQGVFLLTSPDDKPATTPRVWEATGYDRLYFLAQEIGDSYAVAAGAGGGPAVLAAVAALITAAGAPGLFLPDGSAAAKTLAADKVWLLTESTQPTYLGVINDLLATIAYGGLWVDPDGNYRCEPYVAPANRPIEWTHTADDPLMSLVDDSRTRSVDLFSVPNQWRFVQKGLTIAPVEGVGQYTSTNTSNGATSTGARGYLKRKTVFLDAADQSALLAQGNAMIAADLATTTTLKVSTGPFPALGHFDTYRHLDSALGGTSIVQNRSWSLPLRATRTTQTWEVAT